MQPDDIRVVEINSANRTRLEKQDFVYLLNKTGKQSKAAMSLCWQ